ncbi:MAG: DMT family transporter [Gammaproteobacteria bacterium]|jgi:drug/metabolite transporter (DMT)-like permease|nr:DMT family transporter [Gammaproteobacteria bacterium]MDH4005971.1 DMT family transporter [Gammaproteobacteria bacterium]
MDTISRGSQNGWAVSFAGGGAILLWSGTAIANKIAVAFMDPMTAGVLRSMLAGLVAVGIVLSVRLPRPGSRKQWGLLLVSGISSFALWPMLMSLGLGHTTANHTVLIMATLPALTGLLGSALERRLPSRGWWLGIGIAMAGTVYLIFSHSRGALLTEAGGTAGDLIVLVGTLICAVGYVAGGRLAPAIGTWSTTLWGLSAALVVLIPAFVLRIGLTDWATVGAQGWGAIAYMTLFSSLAGYAAWFWALGHGGIARIGSWQFVQPVLSVLLAAALLGEAITPGLAAAAATILLGTVLAQRRAAA